MTARADPKPAARLLPAGVADVALVAADTCAAIGEMSVSWWHEEVRRGRAPAPAIQQPRFTRWRLADVRQFWVERAAASAGDAETRARIVAHALRASRKASATRQARSRARAAV